MYVRIRSVFLTAHKGIGDYCDICNVVENCELFLGRDLMTMDVGPENLCVIYRRTPNRNSHSLPENVFAIPFECSQRTVSGSVKICAECGPEQRIYRTLYPTL